MTATPARSSTDDDNDVQVLPPRHPWRLESLAAAASVLALFVLAVLVTVNVISRWLGRALIPDDIILVQELMVLVVLLPLGLVTALRQHISVDVMTTRAGPQAQRALAILGHVTGLGFATVLLWAAVQELMKAWRTGEYIYGVLNVPGWFGYATFVTGLSLFWLRLVAMLLADLRRGRR